jgi:hypothetical protein
VTDWSWVFEAVWAQDVVPVVDQGGEAVVGGWPHEVELLPVLAVEPVEAELVEAGGLRAYG